ncbi:MAG: pyridoxal-phosphate dependent enzyme, partial [Alphaproteobacteria bacterium]|nr:pyridoxal-phosphate dependent enzyme [Alphaproteobacteria bacterium]
MLDLSRFPRLSFCHLPTPFEAAARLSARLGQVEIWIKRDDCTGLALGGNKNRKLEFLLADAKKQGADVVLTQGAVQSNHARQTAAACARLGLECHILLERRTQGMDANFETGGNVLLDGLFGAKIVSVNPAGTDMAAAMQAHADKLCKEGQKP